MRVLVIGAGAREHALAWRLAQSPSVEAVFAAPGNAGTARIGTNWPEIKPTDGPAIATRAKAEKIDLAVIGPEAPLAAGVADALRAAGITTFGPGHEGARLESSKAFAKQFMMRHGIPTAPFRIAHDLKQAQRYLRELNEAVAVKADGLAAGKGVVVCNSTYDARELLDGWYGEHQIPGGGSTVVIEERLVGRELTVMAVTDGRALVMLEPVCDYKHAQDGDKGPNTGGMGAYSPAGARLEDDFMGRVRREIFEPALAGLKSEGVEYRGCLYAGLMLTRRRPMVLEFNVRFGDPETQVVMPRLEADLAELLHAAAAGDLGSAGDVAGGARVYPQFSPRACVGIVLATEAYPIRSLPVRDLPLPDSVLDADVVAFWAGSTLRGELVDAAGGRVITICALGENLADARTRAYQACTAYADLLPANARIRFRHDIAKRAALTRRT